MCKKNKRKKIRINYTIIKLHVLYMILMIIFQQNWFALLVYAKNQPTYEVENIIFGNDFIDDIYRMYKRYQIKYR